MTDIPLNAKVFCSDGEAGQTKAVIIDPIKKAVTHLVVTMHHYDDRVVPLELVQEADHKSIHLSCTTAELAELPMFNKVSYISGDPDYAAYSGAEWASPYVTAYPIEPLYVPAEQLPPGELAIHRGDPVQATDGHIGAVGEFCINPEDGRITHLVLQKGHLWGKREITLGLDLIDRVEEGEVYLKVDKEAINELPGIKIKRHYPWQKDE